MACARNRWMALGAACAIALSALAAATSDNQDRAANRAFSSLTEPPLMALRVESPMALSGALDQTRLGQHVRSSPLLSAMADSYGAGLRLAGAFLADLPAATVKRLMGREAALVVLPREGQAGATPAVAFVLHMGDDAQLVKDALNNVVIPRLTASPQLTVQDVEDPAGQTLRFRKGANSFDVRLAGDLFLVGTERSVRKFSPSPGERAWTQLAEPEGLSTFYLDLRPIWANALSRGQQPARPLTASGLPGLTSLRGVTRVLDGGFKDTLLARFDKERGGLLGAAAALKARPSACASVVPQDHGLLVSLGIESGERLFGLLEEAVRSSQGEQGVQRLRAAMDQVDRLFAINVEWEVLPAIGQEVFVAARVPDADALASQGGPAREDWATLFGFAVKDEEAFRGLVERFAASPQARQMGWWLVTEGYEGRQIHTLTNMAGPAGFSFALLNGYCVISRDVEAVRDVIRQVIAGKTVGASAQYRDVARHLPAEANAYVYVDTRPLREAAFAVLAQRVPAQGKAYVPLLQATVPELGGYGAALVGEPTQLRLEAYGDAPLAYVLFGATSARIAVQSYR